ncbi:MAG: hypothetical protein Q4A79_01055 [Candidatus Saccharibacteria bacterium]|nr:hypothetical protein [Candidatus Saccharibacteria bacterium]
MDNRDYLNQLVQATRKEKGSKFSFMQSPIFKVVAIGLIVFMLLAIIGAVIGGSKTSAKDQGIYLNLYVSNTLNTVSKYQKELKSSELRSISASLYSILSNTNRELADYLKTTYDFSEGSESDGVKEEAKLQNDGLEADLFEAKISGTLDRIYAHKMVYEISFITSKELSLYNGSSDETLKEILATSYESLSTLYEKFSGFSETK